MAALPAPLLGVFRDAVSDAQSAFDTSLASVHAARRQILGKGCLSIFIRSVLTA
jgi:hypothetical protein